MIKLLTAVSIVQLVEKGKVGLGDNLGKVVPRLLNIEVPKSFGDDGKPITEKRLIQ
jgi:CubicO group peptidase (beta-lactamase class C family)